MNNIQKAKENIREVFYWKDRRDIDLVSNIHYEDRLEILKTHIKLNSGGCLAGR